MSSTAQTLAGKRIASLLDENSFLLKLLAM